MSETTLPVSQPPVTQAPEWEGGSEKPRRHNVALPSASGLQLTFSRKFDQILPPDRTYLRLKRRVFLIVLLVTFVCILALAIGLGVGLGNKSSEDTEDLPLPTDTKKHVGDLTYYEPGLGACGITSTSADNIVSISHITFDAVQVGANPNDNPLCGLTVRATRFNEEAGEERSVDLQVVDRCTGCEPTDLDTTTSVFEQLAAIDDGRVPVTWAWLDPVPTLAA